MSSQPVDTSAHDAIWFESRGARLHAVARGDGPPLVLLHGGLADHRACWLYALPLVERFRVITPDLRGAGRSHDRGPLAWDQLGDDVAALLDHLGLAQAIVGGASFGAGAASAFAVRHPARVAALLVLAPAYAGGDVGFTDAQQAAMQAIGAVGERILSEGTAALHPLFAALPEAMQARARAMVDSFDAASVAATAALMASGAQPFAEGGELARVAAPALVVPGTDDTHPRSAAEPFARHLPRATVVEAEQAGWAAAITAFLDGPAAASGAGGRISSS
jgi:pimeloyl-ACP methyl ester carboxylesterase